MRGYIHSTESFGTLDGPGIRFVVFFQGCPMRCLYCHNPDTWKTGGETMSSDEIISAMKRNMPFYRNGGITATGGEPLMQIEFLTELFQLAAQDGIHTCLDTSGILFDGGEKYSALAEVTNLVMLDIKHMDDREHRRLTSHSNRAVFAFADFLRKRNIPTRLRHVVVPGITYEKGQLEALGQYAASMPNVVGVEILPYHTMGTSKYKNLGIPYPLEGVSPLTAEQEEEARNFVNSGAGRNICI